MTDKFNNQTGKEFSQEYQMNNSSLIESKESLNLNELTDEELITLFKECNYSAQEVSRRFGKFKDYARRIYKNRGIDCNKIKKDFELSKIDKYNKNPNRCQRCKEPLDWKHRNNKYCSSSCAASENNKKRSEKSLKPTKIKKEVKVEEKLKTKLTATYADRRLSNLHNNLLKDRYAPLNIKEVSPGCCHVCGEYHCKKKFCKKHNFQQLIGLVKHFGFNAKIIGTSEVFKEFNRVRKIIYDLYWIEGKSLLELGKMFGFSDGRMPSYLFKILEIPLRTLSQATSNSIKLGKLKIVSDKNCGIIKNIKQSWHETWNGEKVYLRSSYELDYAKELDFNRVKYCVEYLKVEYYDSILNKMRIAIPDFYLPDTNEIVEIKSDFTLNIQEMIDKFNKYKELGYFPKLILEHEEVDLFNIENLIDASRLNLIKRHNIKQFKNKPGI